MGIHSTQLVHKCLRSRVIITFKIGLAILEMLSNINFKVKYADVNDFKLHMMVKKRYCHV